MEESSARGEVVNYDDDDANHHISCIRADLGLTLDRVVQDATIEANEMELDVIRAERQALQKNSASAAVNKIEFIFS